MKFYRSRNSTIITQTDSYRLSSSCNLGQKQLSEMKARLYLNLGLTLESKGDVNSGIEYVAKVSFPYFLHLSYL